MKIDVGNITVSYGKTLAVHQVTLSVQPGETLAMIGPNGSGKSSLVKAIAGLVKYEGRVLFDEAARRPDRIGYMAQDIVGRAALTVTEVVLLGRVGRLGLSVQSDDIRAVSRILTELDLAHLAGRFLGELSGGQRQIVFLAQALAADPRILLLDEPISALDLRHQLEVLELVGRFTRERRLTTICVLHDLNAAARFANRLALMNEGRLFALGTPAEVLTRPIIEQAFEVETDVGRSTDGHPVVTPIRPARKNAIRASLAC